MSELTTAPRLKQRYNSELVTDLKQLLELKNLHDVPRLEKIVINVGLGRGKDDKKLFEAATNTIAKITNKGVPFWLSEKMFFALNFPNKPLSPS